ncbi:MAG TPA: hypothetical protein VIW02_02520 [Gammaproteobacteria bacterium]
MRTCLPALALLGAVALAGCADETQPDSRAQPVKMSEDNAFKPLVDAHGKAGTVEQTLDEASKRQRQALEQQSR